MLARSLIYLAGMTLLIFTLAGPALAGGWAVITLDEWPSRVTAGQPLTISFVVRQHGHRPMADLAPQIIAVHQDTGQSLVVTAQDEGETGHYSAKLTLTRPGTWRWSIRAFTMDQPMPPLLGENGTTSQKTAPAPLLWLIGGVSLVGLAGTSFLWWRTRAGWASALVVATVLAGGLGFVLAAGQPPGPAAAAPTNPVEVGQALFVAKGCITCHDHRGIDLTGNISVDVGPDLTRPAFTPAYLRLWLKDPAAVKPETQMPNLGLNEAEIEALVAFMATAAK